MDLNDDDFLRLARERKGLSQQDLADIVGLSNPAGISVIEHRSRIPKPETLRDIAYALDLRVSDVYLWLTRTSDISPHRA